MSEIDKKEPAYATLARNTTGTFFIRIETNSGFTEIELTAEEFAKASTGMLAKGSVSSGSFD